MLLQRPYRVAPTILRFLAALLDLGLEALLAGVAIWYLFPPEIWPARYWNLFDYVVDVVWTQPKLVLEVVGTFFAVYFMWEVFWAAILGNTPFARMFAMRIVTATGRRPGVFRLILRTVLAALGFILACVGPATALLVPSRRMLHDICCGCYVLLGSVPRETHEQTDSIIVEDRYYHGGPYRF